MYIVKTGVLLVENIRLFFNICHGMKSSKIKNYLVRLFNNTKNFGIATIFVIEYVQCLCYLTYCTTAFNIYLCKKQILSLRSSCFEENCYFSSAFVEVHITEMKYQGENKRFR